MKQVNPQVKLVVHDRAPSTVKAHPEKNHQTLKLTTLKPCYLRTKRLNPEMPKTLHLHSPKIYGFRAYVLNLIAV